MQRLRWIPLLLLGALFASACGAADDPLLIGRQDRFQDVVGTFDATRFVLTSVANPAVQVDLVPRGATFNLRIANDARFTTDFVDVNRNRLSQVGVAQLSGNQLILREDGVIDPNVFDIEFGAPGTFTLTDRTTTFDFDGDGVAEAARLDTVLRRR